ncbi:SDR family oxidoreductase [Streptomyces sp. NBC_01320]|uniref:SDR family oxidoreductase n=1 Tax=Streptomyces sp. NBC_01320 TaxID=2903824 RepID=UPI002E123703|nr:SDR family oxidoreductase [Streptomyces sp. NBC_01320]
MTDGRVQGKVAIVTGGAGGIGAEICRALASRGATVVAADMAPPGKYTGGAADYRELDITDEQDIAYGVLYLASEEARFVTGTELVVDGGCTAVRAVTPDHVFERPPRDVPPAGPSAEGVRAHHGTDAGIHHRIAGHRTPADAAVPHA